MPGDVTSRSSETRIQRRRRLNRLMPVLRYASLTFGVWASVPLAFAGDPPPDKDDFTLFDPTPDSLLRSFSTDRPPKANSPYTVDAGHFQVETDIVVFGYTRQAGSIGRDWTVCDPTLKLGLTNAIDAEVQVTPFETSTTSDAGHKVGIAGIGDTYARIKINLFGNDAGDVAAALLPYVKLPTAQSGLGNDHVEGGLILPVSINAPLGFTVIIMPELDGLKDTADDGYHSAADFLINVSHPLDKKWTAYSEAFTTQSFHDHDEPIYTLDEALTYAITPSVQLDFGANISLNSAAPRVQLYTGLSERF